MVMYKNMVGFTNVTGNMVLTAPAWPDHTDDRKRPRWHKNNVYCNILSFITHKGFSKNDSIH